MSPKAKFLFNIARIHVSFLGTAVILILMAVVFNYQGQVFLFDLFFNLGIAVVGVTVIEFIWRTLGGDPLSKLIDRLQTAIPLLESQMKLGIKQIYANREDINFKDWYEYMRSAHQVDMMGNCLRQNWASDNTFLEILEERTQKQKCMFRILVLHPNSKILTQRAKEEEDKTGRIAATVKESLDKFWKIKKKNSKNGENAFLQIKAVTEFNVRCSIIRVDNRMLVTLYLTSERGREAPTLEIQDERSFLFKKFSAEFEKMWNNSPHWSPPHKDTEAL